MALHVQGLVPASAPTKTRLALLSVAIVDALGGPVEFRPRFSFALLTAMIPNGNFDLPPGVWTDDTSMTICLARSLATYAPADDSDAPPGGFDEAHQLDTYVRWWREGYLSAVDRCFDIGNTTCHALSIWRSHSPAPNDIVQAKVALEQIRTTLGEGRAAGNGSLMRVLPVGLAYWRDEDAARKYARRSSDVTHPAKVCAEACELWTMAIVKIMQNAAGAADRKTEAGFTKLDLLRDISSFPFTCTALRDLLTFRPTAPPAPPPGAEAEESHYIAHHPLLRIISTQCRQFPVTDSSAIRMALPPAKTLPSSGFVVHTLIAALYAFFATATFEDGAILAVNLGNDADTVGAIYGGLAGCWYAHDSGGGGDREELFWTPNVREWMRVLVRRQVVEEVAEELVKFSERLGRQV
jgi:ADP-ribosyl-[dinitrogen reductase] hydrolase